MPAFISISCTNLQSSLMFGLCMYLCSMTHNRPDYQQPPSGHQSPQIRMLRQTVQVSCQQNDRQLDILNPQNPFRVSFLNILGCLSVRYVQHVRRHPQLLRNNIFRPEPHPQSTGGLHKLTFRLPPSLLLWANSRAFRSWIFSFSRSMSFAAALGCLRRQKSCHLIFEGPP